MVELFLKFDFKLCDILVKTLDFRKKQLVWHVEHYYNRRQFVRYNDIDLYGQQATGRLHILMLGWRTVSL